MGNPTPNFIPVKSSEEWPPIFLARREAGEGVEASADAAGVSSSTVRMRRSSDPQFATAEALAVARWREAQGKRVRSRIEKVGELGEAILDSIKVEMARKGGGQLTAAAVASMARDEESQRAVALGAKLIADWVKTVPQEVAHGHDYNQVDVTRVQHATNCAPTMREFIDNDLGPSVMPIESLYPRVEWILAQADRPDVRTVILQMGKGSGKGIILATFLARCLQRLLSMPDAGLAYRLMPGVKVAVLNLSVTGNQAQLAVFDDLGRIVTHSEWFKQFGPKLLANQIEFNGRNVIAFCGNSSSKGVEGVAWLAAGADEVSRLPEDEHLGPAQAKELVEPVEATMLTRFAADRKMLIASWPEHRDDYIGQRIEAARKVGVREDLTAEMRAIPIVRDNQVMDAGRRGAIAQAPFNEYQCEAFIANDGTLCVTAPTWEMKPDSDLGAFAAMFESNKVQAARMIGARPLPIGENPFFRDVAEFERGASARPNPISEDGRFLDWFKGQPNEWYFGHIDLGVRHDAAGIAVAHYDGGRVVYDLLMEVRPPQGGELRIGMLLDVFADMRRRGFEFMKVTRDGYQGIAVGQDLESRGVNTEEFSVDKNRAAYDTFKTAWLAGQLDYYASKPLFECVRSLVDLGKKVDHTAGGKKDLSDAAAAVCLHVLESVV